MKAGARFYGYALACVGLMLVVSWAGYVTWQELRQLRQSFAAVQADAFHLSEHIEASIRDVNEIVLRFDLRRQPEDWKTFQKKSHDLQQWMRARQPSITTTEERELVGQIETAFEAYLSRMADERARGEATVAPNLALEQVEKGAASILALCEKLNAAERMAQTQFMKDSLWALGWLQELLIVQLGLLMILVGTAVVAVYRGIIDPLRTKLVESRLSAARSEQLASLGTLAAGVAHEIRNPLTAINVRLHSLKKSFAANSSEEEDALVIGHEIQRLERIVQGFLLFARPAAPKCLAVSADSLLARVQLLFGPRLEKTAIRFTVESVPDVWVRVDPHQIEQVLINLIQNAVESLAGEGAITLRVRTSSARLANRACPVVILEVSDTGKGILPEVQKRMFDPFYTTKEEGTGLGLAIAARIVERHGGALECRSEVNRGTTFAILLPHSKPEESDEHATQDSIN